METDKDLSEINMNEEEDPTASLMEKPLEGMISGMSGVPGSGVPISMVKKPRRSRLRIGMGKIWSRGVWRFLYCF